MIPTRAPDKIVMAMLPVPVMQLRPERRAHVVLLVEHPILITRFIIPSSCAEPFTIADILIEDESQLASPAQLDNPIPARVFTELSIGIALSMGVAKKGSVVDILFVNPTKETKPLTFTLMGETKPGTKFEAITPPADERTYHAWCKRRQKVYENLHRGEGDDCFFNGQEILPDTFLPQTSRWWVDADGWKDRPVYQFEKVALGDKRGGLQVVDIETYEGFE